MTGPRGYGGLLANPAFLAAMATVRAAQADCYLGRQQLLLAHQHAGILAVSRAQTLFDAVADASMLKTQYVSPAMALIHKLRVDFPPTRSSWDPPNWSDRWWATDEWSGFDG